MEHGKARGPVSRTQDKKALAEAIVKALSDGQLERVIEPASAVGAGHPRFDQRRLQLEAESWRHPGHLLVEAMT